MAGGSGSRIPKRSLTKPIVFSSKTVSSLNSSMAFFKSSSVRTGSFLSAVRTPTAPSLSVLLLLSAAAPVDQELIFPDSKPSTKISVSNVNPSPNSILAHFHVPPLQRPMRSAPNLLLSLSFSVGSVFSSMGIMRNGLGLGITNSIGSLVSMPIKNSVLKYGSTGGGSKAGISVLNLRLDCTCTKGSESTV